MSGNYRILLLVWLRTALCYADLFKQAEIRGGLLFERDTEKAAIINPSYMVYRRQLDLRGIQKSVALAKQFTREYGIFCETVKKTMDTEVELRHHAYAHKFHTVEGIQRTINAKTWCQSVGLNPPEIRTHSDLHDLIEYANLVNVTNVDINIEYNNDIGRMIYMSDKTPITNVLAYVQIPNPQSIALYSTIRIHDPLAVQKWQDARRGYLYIDGKKAL